MNEQQRDGLPTGEDTAEGNDVADPHPATEEHYDQIKHPGGVHRPPGPDIGTNNAVHNGTPPRRPDNAETVPLSHIRPETDEIIDPLATPAPGIGAA